MALDGQNETFIARIKDAVPVSDGKKKFTVYLTEVKPPWFYNVPPYTVHRRYREFLALYKDLCNMFGKGQIAVPFPKKKALGSMGASVVNYRKGALQTFFDAVSANEKMGKHKLIQDFLAHRPGEDPPKPSPQKQKVKPQAAKKAEAPTEGVVVAGSKRTEAAAAMRVAAATPGMKSAAGAGTSHNQPPVHQDEEEVAAEAKAKAEAERKAKKAADAKARADAEAERKAQLEMERKAAAEKREKEAAEQKAKAAAERAAKAEAEQAAPAPTPTPTPSTPAATAAPPPTAAPSAGAAEWPTLPGLSQRLIREAEKALTGGDFGGAAGGFDEAIGSLDEGQTEFHIVRCELWVKRADCLLHDGQARLAATELTKALELVPGHPEALLRRARAMQQREKFREAFTDFQDCVVHRGPTERAARAGLQEVIKMLEQLGDGSWVRQNRKV